MVIAVVSMIRDPWGGSEELWYQMAKVALAQGHKVIHLRYETPNRHEKLQELISQGLISYERPGWIPRNSSETQRFAYLGYNFFRKKITNTFDTLVRLNPDIVLYNGTCYSIAKEKKLLKLIYKKKIPKFFILGQLNHDFIRDISDTDAELIKMAYRSASKVFFVSRRNLEAAERHLATTIDNFAIVRNPVNLDDTAYIPYPNEESSINFAMVGNLVTIHKGQDIALSVLGSDQWQNRQWKLNVYGSGPDKFYLESLAKQLSIRHKIVFHGTISNIRDVWRKNHVLLMPSIMEGMPLAVVEAMLCGRTVVATDVGGNSEWINSDIEGFIAESPSVSSFGKALERLWARRSELEIMGIRAHEKASALYDQNAGVTLLNLLLND